MNKLFTKIASVSLGLALAAGVGVALGQKGAVKAKAAEVLTYTLDGTVTDTNTSPYNKYQEASLVTQSEIQWSVMGNTTQNPWRVGGSNKNGLGSTPVDRAVFSKGAISQNISKVYFTAGAGYVSSDVSYLPSAFHLIVSTAEDGGGTVVSDLEMDFVASSTMTFERPAGKDWTGCFYKFVFSFINNTGTNKFIHFTKVEFKYEVSAVTPDTVSVSGESGVSVGATTTLTATCTKGGSTTGVNQNVVWSSSDETVARVSEAGVVTGISNGTATIYAKAEDNESISGSKSVTVSGGKTDNSAFTIVESDVDFGGYGNFSKAVSGVYMHFVQTASFSSDGVKIIQLQAAKGIVENVSALPSQIEKIELYVAASSNGADYVLSVSSDGETYTPVAASGEGNRLSYTISAGNYYFKLTAGTGTLRLHDILVSLGNAVEAKLVALAASLNVLLDADCKGAEDVSAISAEAWAAVKAEYDAGDSDAKAALAAVGSNLSYHEVNQFLERYDHIVAGYGYTNFLERAVDSSVVRIDNLNNDLANDTVMIIIIVTAAISVIAFGALLLNKKRKHN